MSARTGPARPRAGVGGIGGSALLLGNYLPSLAAARSLAAAGFRVVVGDGGESCTVAHSRACDEVWKHPPIQRSDDLLDALVTFLAGRPDVSIVLPLEESYVAFLARHRDRVPAGPIVAMPDPVTVSTCLDKGSMYRIAREEGVTCLPVSTAHDLASLNASAVDVGFPCLVKPVGRGIGTLPGDRKALVCADEGALARAFDVWPAGHAELLVQRYVRAPRDNVYFVARRGTIVACIESRILRTDRADGTGINVAAVTVPLVERVVQQCEALARRLGYTGVGLFQFLMPARDEPIFMELNPRHGAGMAFMQACGLDLTLAACALASGTDLWHEVPGSSYPIGKRYAWTAGDLRGLWLSRARGEVDRAGALGWLAEALRSAVRADVHATWSPRDPLPTMMTFLRAGPRAVSVARSAP